MDQSAPNQFRAALTYLLAQEGRGAQTRLANQQKIDRGYLNAIVRGRKSGSERKRSEIAAYFNMTYEDMLALGRRILQGEENPTLKKGNGVELRLKENLDRGELSGETPDFNITPKYGAGASNIPDRIVRVIEVLSSGTGYDDLLAGLIDAFHDTVSTKKENLALKNKLREMESRIASLEKRLVGQKDCIRKSA